MYTIQHERIESEIVDFLIIARSKEGGGDGPWHKIEIDFVRPLLSHISKQLVSSIASIFFSLSFRVILSGQGRVREPRFHTRGK